MIEFLQECIQPVNLPATIVLVLLLAYWLLVIVGVLGLDVIDLDLDLDADADLGVDADVDGGAFADALNFMHLGDVPVMIVGSILILVMWFFTIVSNHYLNQDGSFVVSLIWMIPNLIVSLLITKILLLPMVTFFKHRETPEITRDNMIGLKGVVKTSEVTEKFGQLEIRIEGPPIVVNVRSADGNRLARGDLAEIKAYNSADNTFTVELSKWEKE